MENNIFDDFMKSIEDKLLLNINNFKEESDSDNNENKEEWDIIIRTRKQTDKNIDSIYKKLESLMLSQDVLELTKYYFNTTLSYKNNYRKKFRNTIMCACVYFAFSKTGNHRDANSLKEFFSVSNEKYTSAVKMVKLAIPEIRHIKETYENQVYNICLSIGITSEIKNVKDFVICFTKTNYGNQLLKSPKLKKRHIFFIGMYPWLIINKTYIIEPKKFASITGISKIAIIESIKNNIEVKNHIENLYHYKIKKFSTILNEKYNINYIFSYENILVTFSNIIKKVK